MALNEKQLNFVTRLLQGERTGDAYHNSFGGTENAASVRSLASKTLKNPEVMAAIREGIEKQKTEAIECGVWTLAVSLASRTALLRTLQDEMNRKHEGLNMELQGLDMDENLTPSQRLVAKGRAMQKSVIGRDMLSACISLLDSLDRAAFCSGKDGDYCEKGIVSIDPESDAKRKADLDKWNAEMAEMFGNRF